MDTFEKPCAMIAPAGCRGSQRNRTTCIEFLHEDSSTHGDPDRLILKRCLASRNTQGGKTVIQRAPGSPIPSPTNLTSLSLSLSLYLFLSLSLSLLLTSCRCGLAVRERASRDLNARLHLAARVHLVQGLGIRVQG